MTIASVLIAVTGCARATLDQNKLLDLSHAFDRDTVYWPTARKFELTEVAHGHTAGGYWYASNDFCASEHGGTHIDAPIHFAEGRRATADIPLEQLIGPARVIDIRQQCAADSDYVLVAEDVLEHERVYGEIGRGSVVLVLTGWGEHYGDLERYLGSAKRGVVENLHFPGIGAAAAELLVERGIDMVGLDTASLDHGQSTDYAAHQVFGKADVPGLENVANLHLLPARGALIIALPMKIAGGSGGPCRIVAVLP